MLKGRRLFTWIWLLVVVMWYVFKSGPAPLQAEGGINSLEQIQLGGMKQWISIRGTDIHNPVLLFLHGGPGSANLAKLRIQVPELERQFVVVNWDQRGAGKSYSPGFDISTLSLKQYVSDAHELVGILRQRFNVEKIYLMGFSWGTVIGLSLADQYPDDFLAYISVSQEVDFKAGEKASLEYVRQTALTIGNTQAMTELSSVDPSYASPGAFAQLMTERKWLLQFGGVYHHANSYSHEAWMMLKAPEYSLVEFAFWPMGSSNSLKWMWPKLMNINFFEQIPVVRCPFYFFVGRYDYNTPSQLTETYYQKVEAPAGKHLIWFENSAHDLFFDEPRKVVKEIVRISEKNNEE
jgi:pimeloyl-ACP methyl ester carboxylesterase